MKLDDLDNLGNIGDIMKQAQGMQEKVQKIQDEIAESESTGESGAGMVKVVMTGQHDVRSVNIDPALMAEDKEVLEDLIAAAINDAVRKVETTTQQKMSSLTGGMQMPAGFKMPF